MEQHPIPQQISSYEFKLVGDMTLKQFLKAAGGIVIALLINSTELMVLAKWPLMLLFGGGGLLLAFMPIEDRPLETWFISFIKSIYSPTIYTYQRKINENWLDLDLTKSTKHSEEDIVIKGKIKSNLIGSKIKDTINTMGIKTEKKEEKKEEIQAVKVDNNQIKKEVVEEKVEIKNEREDGVKKNDWRDQKTELKLKTEKLGATGKVIFGSIPMPDIPEIPNVVVGMATDFEGKIVDGVIVEIQDENGNPSRVLKTNSLGQFKITTPLASGRYLIIAEKDGYNFDRVNIDLKGQIVQPIKIIANS
ncbi:MAG: carboxypeptidase-like regulatory domain-containing protein [Candidatus Shapirobacteria bacterium]